MSDYLIQGQTLSEIAEAIREKLGISDSFPVSSMAELISSIQGGGIQIIPDENLEWDAYLTKTLRTINDTEGKVKTIGIYAFEFFTYLSKVYFPSATYINTEGFAYCSSLRDVSLPNLVSTSTFVFRNCIGLTDLNLPSLTEIGQQAFQSCYNLRNVSMPSIKKINNWAFRECSSLTSLNLTGVSSVPIGFSSMFNFTPIQASTYTGSFGSIYVPNSLLNDFRAASGWSVFYDRIVGV